MFSLARFEKVDIEPTPELLASYGMKRGFISWSPWTIETRPSGWSGMWRIFAFSHYHSTRSAFTLLESESYEKKWEPTAQRKRKHIRKMMEEGIVRIETRANPEEFLRVYARTKISHSHQDFYMKRQKSFYVHAPESIRTYIAYVDGQPLAGATFLDDHPTSTYLIGFQDAKAKDYHLGLALMDAWFGDSENQGFRFLDLDHMRDIGEPRSFAGYTHFKSRIADYEVLFREVWFRWMS